MKWPCQRYAIWLNKRELQDLRAALNTTKNYYGHPRCGEVLCQIRSHLKPETRLDNELSVRAWSVSNQNADCDKQKVKMAIESGEAAKWRNCGKKTIAELSAWCGASTLNPSHHDGAASAPSVDGVVGLSNQEEK